MPVQHCCAKPSRHRPVGQWQLLRTGELRNSWCTILRRWWHSACMQLRLATRKSTTTTSCGTIQGGHCRHTGTEAAGHGRQVESIGGNGRQGAARSRLARLMRRWTGVDALLYAARPRPAATRIVVRPWAVLPTSAALWAPGRRIVSGTAMIAASPLTALDSSMERHQCRGQARRADIDATAGTKEEIARRPHVRKDQTAGCDHDQCRLAGPRECR